MGWRDRYSEVDYWKYDTHEWRNVMGIQAQGLEDLVEKRVVIVVPFNSGNQFVRRGETSMVNLAEDVKEAMTFKDGMDATTWAVKHNRNYWSWTLASITIRSEPTITLGEVL